MYVPIDTQRLVMMRTRHDLTLRIRRINPEAIKVQMTYPPRSQNGYEGNHDGKDQSRAPNFS